MAGSLLQGNDDGMNELDFQTVLHILVHAHIGDAVAVIQGADAELVYVVLIVPQDLLHSHCIPAWAASITERGRSSLPLNVGSFIRVYLPLA